jgi:hypothetical protein
VARPGRLSRGRQRARRRDRVPRQHDSADPLLARAAPRAPGAAGRLGERRPGPLVRGAVPRVARRAERLFAWQTARPERQAILLSGDAHAGAAFRLGRRRSPGTLWQWTSSPLTTPISPSQGLANWAGAAHVARGEWRYRVARQALVLGHNFGLVELVSLASGGHQLTFTLHAYTWRRRALRPPLGWSCVQRARRAPQGKCCVIVSAITQHRHCGRVLAGDGAGRRGRPRRGRMRRAPCHQGGRLWYSGSLRASGERQSEWRAAARAAGWRRPRPTPSRAHERAARTRARALVLAGGRPRWRRT